MSKTRTLGPWLRRFPRRAHRHRAQPRPQHAEELPRHLRPPPPLRQHQDPQGRRSDRGSGPHGPARTPVPRPPRRRPRLLRADPQPTALGDPAPSRASSPAATPSHLEWSGKHTCDRLEKGHPTAHRLAHQDRDERPWLEVPDTRTPRGRIEHTLPPLPLQHRRTRLRSNRTRRRGPANRSRQGRARARPHPRQGLAGTGSAHSGREPKMHSHSSCTDGTRTMPSSSVSCEGPTHGSGSIGSSSVPQPACRRSPRGKSHRTRSVTQAPVTSCSPASISIRSAPGSAMSASTPPTSMPRSISR